MKLLPKFHADKILNFAGLELACGILTDAKGGEVV